MHPYFNNSFTVNPYFILIMKKLCKLSLRACGFTGVLLLGFFSRLQAQSQVVLRLSFNTDQNRYQVYAKPDFTAKNFTWGPSQVTVVLPAELADQPLSIRSTNVGSWADNSVVYAPASALKSDFHGMTTPGGKVDMVAGQEVLLFDFLLKPGFVANVRLFDSMSDPNSGQPGMKGGDFQNYMSDQKGVDYVRVNSQAVVLDTREATVSSESVTQVVAYPNPSTGGKFRLYLKGFQDEETVTVRLMNINGLTLHSFEEKVTTLSGRAIDVSESVDGYVLLSLERQATHQLFIQKLWFR